MYWKLKSLLISFILAFSCGFNINTYADDSKTLLDTIVDTVSHLNCQSKGVGDLLRSEFAHTCVPAPFFSLAVYNLVSPGIFVNSMLCLKINDESLFPASPSWACKLCPYSKVRSSDNIIPCKFRKQIFQPGNRDNAGSSRIETPRICEGNSRACTIGTKQDSYT